MFSQLTMVWKVVTVAVSLSLLVGPYIGLYIYIPKYNKAKVEIAELRLRTDKDGKTIDDLTKVKETCIAATEKMREARLAADLKRENAQKLAELKAPKRQDRINQIKLKLMETRNEQQECARLKELVNSFTGVSTGRM